MLECGPKQEANQRPARRPPLITLLETISPLANDKQFLSLHFSSPDLFASKFAPPVCPQDAGQPFITN